MAKRRRIQRGSVRNGPDRCSRPRSQNAAPCSINSKTPAAWYRAENLSPMMCPGTNKTTISRAADERSARRPAAGVHHRLATQHRLPKRCEQENQKCKREERPKPGAIRRQIDQGNGQLLLVRHKIKNCCSKRCPLSAVEILVEFKARTRQGRAQTPIATALAENSLFSRFAV